MEIFVVLLVIGVLASLFFGSLVLIDVYFTRKAKFVDIIYQKTKEGLDGTRQ